MRRSCTRALPCRFCAHPCFPAVSPSWLLSLTCHWLPPTTSPACRHGSSPPCPATTAAVCLNALPARACRRHVQLDPHNCLPGRLYPTVHSSSGPAPQARCARVRARQQHSIPQTFLQTWQSHDSQAARDLLAWLLGPCRAAVGARSVITASSPTAAAPYPPLTHCLLAHSLLPCSFSMGGCIVQQLAASNSSAVGAVVSGACTTQQQKLLHCHAAYSARPGLTRLCGDHRATRQPATLHALFFCVPSWCCTPPVMPSWHLCPLAMCVPPPPLAVGGSYGGEDAPVPAGGLEPVLRWVPLCQWHSWPGGWGRQRAAGV